MKIIINSEFDFNDRLVPCRAVTVVVNEEKTGYGSTYQAAEERLLKKIKMFKENGDIPRPKEVEVEI